MVKNPWEVDDESQLRSRKRNCYLACIILIIFVVIFQRGFELIKLNRRAIINCQNSLSKRSRRSQSFIFYQSCPSLPFLMKKTFASRIKYSPFQSSNIYLPFSKIKIDKKSSKKIKNLHKKSKRKNRNLDLISLDFLFNLHQKKISFHPLLFWKEPYLPCKNKNPREKGKRKRIINKKNFNQSYRYPPPLHSPLNISFEKNKYCHSVRETEKEKNRKRRKHSLRHSLVAFARWKLWRMGNGGGHRTSETAG